MESSSLRKRSETGKECLFEPQKSLLGAQEFFGGPRVARFGPNCHRLVKLIGPNLPLLGSLKGPQSTQGTTYLWAPTPPQIHFYVLMTTAPEAVSLYFMILYGNELSSILGYPPTDKMHHLGFARLPFTKLFSLCPHHQDHHRHQQFKSSAECKVLHLNLATHVEGTNTQD